MGAVGYGRTGRPLKKGEVMKINELIENMSEHYLYLKRCQLEKEELKETEEQIEQIKGLVDENRGLKKILIELEKAMYKFRGMEEDYFFELYRHLRDTYLPKNFKF
jgi:hypothetical protein